MRRWWPNSKKRTRKGKEVAWLWLWLIRDLSVSKIEKLIKRQNTRDKSLSSKPNRYRGIVLSICWLVKSRKKLYARKESPKLLNKASQEPSCLQEWKETFLKSKPKKQCHQTRKSDRLKVLPKFVTLPILTNCTKTLRKLSKENANKTKRLK